LSCQRSPIAVMWFDGLADSACPPAPVPRPPHPIRPNLTTSDPAARTPGRPLRRRVQVKHRTCTFPGCRRPAADSQTDHRRDYARHGPTDEDNLAPACTYHHDLKTRWGWRIVKRDHQTYLWISPYGRKHLVTIEPDAPPLPDPPDRPDEKAA